MLQTPRNLGNRRNPIAEMIAAANGNEPTTVRLADGFNQIGHFSGDMLIWGSNAPEHYMGYPELGVDMPGCYGVCDSPEAFIEAYSKRLADDVRTFCVFFTHVKKHPENKGDGGGWRWHKWGEYIGKGSPQCEYLDDEEGFDDGVYTYHVYQIDGPEIE